MERYLPLSGIHDFVQQVARNRELHIEVYHFVQQVVRYEQNRELRIKIYHSCNKLHAMHKIVNDALRFIIRATSCMLRSKSLISHRD